MAFWLIIAAQAEIYEHIGEGLIDMTLVKTILRSLEDSTEKHYS